MPQLETADFLPQLFWLAITFVTLYFILARLALPQISGIREERANRIAADLETAEELQRKADDAHAAYEATLAQARSQAATITADTRARLKTHAEARLREVSDKLAAEADAAEARIAKARAEAIAGISDVAATACADIVAKLTTLKIDDGVVQSAVTAQLEAGEKGAR